MAHKTSNFLFTCLRPVNHPPLHGSLPHKSLISCMDWVSRAGDINLPHTPFPPARSPPNNFFFYFLQSPYLFTIDRLFSSIVEMFRINFYRVSLDFIQPVSSQESETVPTSWNIFIFFIFICIRGT